MKPIRFALTMSMLLAVPALSFAQKTPAAGGTGDTSAATTPQTQEAHRADALSQRITIRGFGSDGAELSAEQQRHLGGAVKALKGAPAKVETESAR